MKVLILLCYFNRPILVKNALNSILKSNEYYQNWELVFGDDGSIIPGQPIVEDILKNHLDKVKFVNSHDSVDDKLIHGIQLGKYANEEVLKSKADIIITLSDDDELVPSYINNLVSYFKKYPKIMYCYSKINVYNPLFQDSSNQNLTNVYNKWCVPINPVNKLDASQVAFRNDCFQKFGVRFPETTKLDDTPWIKNIDAGLFEQLWNKFGDCPFTNLISQHKGIHDYQLVWHKKNDIDSLRQYIKKINELAGKVF